MEKNKTGKKGISGAALKWIAIVSMLVDHFACVFFYGNYVNQNNGFLNGCFGGNEQAFVQTYSILREIGRLAFPIFCFLLVQGALHTTSRRNYLGRMLVFCFISEIPFDLALHGSVFTLKYQNVFFTLWIGLFLLFTMEWLEQNEKRWLQWPAIFAAIFLAEALRTDYGGHGIVLIVVFYLLRYAEKWRILLGSFYEIFIMGIGEAAAALAFIPMHFYNGTKGRSMKYFFYAFYPLHLLVLYLINQFVFG